MELAPPHKQVSQSNKRPSYRLKFKSSASPRISAPYLLLKLNKGPCKTPDLTWRESWDSLGRRKQIKERLNEKPEWHEWTSFSKHGKNISKAIEKKSSHVQFTIEDDIMEKLRFDWSYASYSQFFILVSTIFIMCRENQKTKFSRWTCYKDKLRWSS